MESSTPQRRFIPVVLAFAVGFGLAWIIRTPDPAPGAAAAVAAAGPRGAGPTAGAFGDAAAFAGAPPRSAPAGAAPAQAAGVDELWTRALMPGAQSGVRGETSYAAEDSLRKLAQADPAARRTLIGLYDTARTAQARALLQATLATVQTPDVVFFANRLANSSDVADRAFGFEMLRSVAPNAPETRALVQRTLAGEQSSEVLLAALSALPSATVEPDEAAQLRSQLTSLSQHADPAVRSRSITQLGQWDRSGESGAHFIHALNDSAPEVRQAAIFAIAQAGVRSPGIQGGLLALAGNAQESRDLRGSALQVLERFPLSHEEYAHFARLRAQLGGMQ